MEAITREEKIISGENLTPITRKEMFLAKAAGQDVKTPEPITREEMFLNRISGGGSGGAELNIAYGDTPPEDTSKLWCKTAEPNKIHIGYKMPSQKARIVADEVNAQSSDEFEELSVKLPASMSAPAVTVGQKIYLFGGVNDKNTYSTILRFDAETESIEPLSVTMPYVVSGFSLEAVGTKIYLFGGSKSAYYNTILCFDTETESISTLSVKLPLALTNMASATVGTKIYLFGGLNSSYNKEQFIYCFDTETESISTLSVKLPEGHYNMRAATIGEKIYLFGGVNVSNIIPNTIFCFDTETESIRTLSATLPMSMLGSGVVAVGTKIYVLGGNHGSNRYDTVLRFDAETESIEPLSVTMPFGGSNYAAYCNSKIYVFGGYSGFYRDTIYSFAAVMILENGVLVILQDSSKITFPIINTDALSVELGIGKVYKGNANNEGDLIEAYLYKDGEWTLI